MKGFCAGIVLLALLFTQALAQFGGGFTQTNALYTSRVRSFGINGEAPNIRGLGFCQLQRNTNATQIPLSCTVQHSGDPSTVDIFIGNGETGRGKRVFTFPKSNSQQVSAIFTIKDDLTYAAYFRGNLYIQVNANNIATAGGQLIRNDRFVAQMDQGQVNCRSPPENGATGIILSEYYDTNPVNTLFDIEVIHSLKSVTSSKIFEGIVCKTSKTLVGDLDAGLNIQVDSTQVPSLFGSGTYGVIRNSERSIRGQLYSVDPIPIASFSTILVSNKHLDKNGFAIFDYSCKTRGLEFLLVHNINPSEIGKVEIKGSSGTVFSTVYPGSALYGIAPIPEKNDFLGGDYEILILDSNGKTLIGGNIESSSTSHYYSYITGTLETPPVSTEAVGLAKFLIDKKTGSINYVLSFADMSNVISILLRKGEIGTDGKVLYTFSSTDFYQSGSFNGSKELVSALTSDNLYISISSSRYPNGEIRGQIYPFFSTCS